MTQPTAEQLEMIEQQLGRKPRGIVRIAYATEQGVPVVLQMRSLLGDQPFPTLYWLSSSDLHQAIAEIETSGWVKQIEQEIAEDAELRARYHAQQQAYVDKRWQEMHPADKAEIEALGFSHLFDQYGIGGIAQWDKVRCLHMQYAHHLVADNIIGPRMDQEFSLQDKLADIRI